MRLDHLLLPRQSGAMRGEVWGAILLGLAMWFGPPALFAAENRGAGSLDWWAFQPVVRPAVPQVTGAASGAVDAFVRARLAEQGLAPAPKECSGHPWPGPAW